MNIRQSRTMHSLCHPYINRTLFLLLLILVATSFTGCSKTGREADLSISENLAVSHEWCVITIPYAAFKEVPSEKAEVINHGRRSDIYEVIGKKYITEKNQTILWYQSDKGWLPETSVIVYENQLKAQTASESMNE